MSNFIPQSSLYKPFWDVIPTSDYRGQSMMRNEVLSFQFVCCPPSERKDSVDAYVNIDSPIPCAVYEVINHAVQRPTYPQTDENYERVMPGLYPDALLPLAENKRIRLNKYTSTSVWVTLNPDRLTLDAGEYTVKATLTVGSNSETAEVKVKVIDAVLPEQSLIYTNWFHCDCLCDRYGCKMFDERHWALIESYARMAAKNGMNMILTPCFTPPLDTNVGGERMTAQLIDVTKTKDGYRFGFDKLRRFLKLCEDCGIRYFEHSHLFTQWGAQHAPKVMAETENGYERIFGWETDAVDPDGEYANFLRQYLSELVKVLKETGVGNRMYFHISDEPGVKDLDNYKAALAIIEPYTEGYHKFDALSSYEFYKSGAVETPVPTTTHIDEFLGNVDNLWTYYCGLQCSGNYSNRLMSMPNARNRAIGIQMWFHNIKGFLQWAYNFWYTRMSERQFDPWSSPDADRYFVGGTSYMVYPGNDGPIPSMRLYSFAEGIDDYRALELYASLAGREKAEQLVLDAFDGMSDLLSAKGNVFSWCPVEGDMLRFRAMLGEAVEAALTK